MSLWGPPPGLAALPVRDVPSPWWAVASTTGGPSKEPGAPACVPDCPAARGHGRRMTGGIVELYIAMGPSPEEVCGRAGGRVARCALQAHALSVEPVIRSHEAHNEPQQAAGTPCGRVLKCCPVCGVVLCHAARGTDEELNPPMHFRVWVWHSCSGARAASAAVSPVCVRVCACMCVRAWLAGWLQVTRQLQHVIGQPAMPPRWALGFHQSR